MIPQCRMLPLSHTHGTRLGKVMEERPLAKRFRPLITIHGCEVFECDQGCRGDISSVVLPDGIGKVGLSAYKYCLHLTSVTMPNSVKVVGESAFEHCRSLSSLTLSNSLRIVGENAFCDCIGLTSLTLPNSVQRLGFRAFTRCGGLTSLTLSNSLTSIGASAFSDCKVWDTHCIPWNTSRGLH